MLQKKMENGNGFGNAETLKNKGFSIICCQCCHILYMKIEINNKNTYMAYMAHIIQGYIHVRTRATATQEGCSMLEREIEKTARKVTVCTRTKPGIVHSTVR